MAMTPDELDSLHRSVFRISGRDPMWLGFWISHYAQSEGLDLSDVAAELGVTADSLSLFCICRTPRADHFREDLTVACERTGAKLDVAARIVRQEQAMLRWRDGDQEGKAGWMLAASDANQSSTSTHEEEAHDDEDEPS
jgi:hypothetical protein